MSQKPDLTKMPAAKPPPGVTPDFNSPDNYKTENIILHSVILLFVTIAVLMRMYTRALVKKTFGIDDWFCIIAFLLCIAQSTIFGYATRLGFGMHLWDIRASEIVHCLKVFSAGLKMYMPAILTVKLCILIGFYRVFKVYQMARWAIWFGMAANIIFYVVCFFIDIFRCKPMAAAWNPSIKGKCLPYTLFPWITGIFNVISDFYILAIPMPILFNMNMDIKRRIKIISIFSLGLFTCITSIMRVVATAQASGNPDKLYFGAKYMHWPILELNVGLICACALTFPAFFDSSLPNSLGSFIRKVRSRNASASSSRTDVDNVARMQRADIERPSCGSKPASLETASQEKQPWGVDVSGMTEGDMRK
ncbi:hypothetical protein GQ44DRAFT_824348 [Phaeosphaeriaceae sp. PMI808]|nr:hypothetical protein GQ44DRAFT_824348 [Phaeosphaeriaceae sp. PMI808]